MCVHVLGLCPGLKHSSGPPLTEHLLEEDGCVPAAVGGADDGEGCVGALAASGYRGKRKKCVRVQDDKVRENDVQWCRVFHWYQSVCVCVRLGVGVQVSAQVTGGAETAETQ